MIRICQQIQIACFFTKYVHRKCHILRKVQKRDKLKNNRILKQIQLYKCRRKGRKYEEKVFIIDVSIYCYSYIRTN